MLTVRELRLWLPVHRGRVQILEDVSFTIDRGEAFGLVGESGSGKSMTARCITRLLPEGAEVSGELVMDGAPVASMDSADLRRLRSSKVQMIFQDPRAHINPVRRVGDFVTEVLVRERGVEQRVANQRAVDVLESIGVAGAKARLTQYPHELSGGLLQRIMIASALVVEPELLIADEPTTALDVTTQADVVAVLDQLRRDRGLALLFITHDLELAAAICDRTGVMYAGTLVEVQASTTLHQRPQHPYTAALIGARPSLTAQVRPLTIPGAPVSLADAPPGCAFAPRCAYSDARCVSERPPLREIGAGSAACVRADEIRSELAELSESASI